MKSFFLMCAVAVLVFSTPLQAGDCGNAAIETRVNLVTREPIRPVRNILAKIRDVSAASAASCSGVDRVAVVRVQRVRVVSRVALCSGAAAPFASSCAGPRASSCAGSIQAPQAYGLGIELKVAKPSVVRSTGLAQQKADRQASEGRMAHLSGGFGGGTREGVGFSTESANDAIRHSSYYGQYPPIDIGVARGKRGWYATVIY